MLDEPKKFFFHFGHALQHKLSNAVISKFDSGQMTDEGRDIQKVTELLTEPCSLHLKVIQALLYIKQKNVPLRQERVK